VLGPPRSGKTSSIVVPNVVCANGSVVCVSTKRDVLHATAGARQRLGPCYLFDPSGATPTPPGVARVSWSPLDTAGNWDQAVLGAEAMVGASRAAGARGESSHWAERAGALLSSIYHGAAIAGQNMDAVASSVNRREPEQWSEALSGDEATIALDVLNGILDTDAREQSGIWSTAAGVLRAYRTRAALESSSGQPLNFEEFCRTPSTLYVVAGSESQEHLAPVIAGLVRDLRTAAYEQSGRGARDPATTRPPLLLILDELANIAPLHDLPTLVAEGASQGVLTLACLQDLSQARSRWGAAADGFFSLFGAKVVLGGIGDVRTLEALSLLAGEREVALRTVSTSRQRRLGPRQQQRSISTRRDRVLPPDRAASPPPGMALAVFGASLGQLELTPYYRTSPFREALHARPGPEVYLGRGR
jgi:type IV secretion system protein VirD4